MPQHALAADRPGVFTARQRNGIKKIARNSGLPHDQQWDFVHETWVKVAEVWPQVPRVEPRMSRYIFRMAKNLAIDLFRRFKEDAMTGAVVFSCLEAWEQKREEKQEAGERFEDDLGMPQVARPRVDARTRAEQFMKHAVGRDPEAAGWMWRMRVEGETGPEIAAAVGQSSKNVYQRVSRLEEALARLEPPEPQTIGRLVEAYAEERGVDLRRRGRLLGSRGGAGQAQLAVEIAWTGDRPGLAAYRALGVREVWSWEEGRICVFVLDGARCEEVDRSALLPELDLSRVAWLASRESQAAAVSQMRELARG